MLEQESPTIFYEISRNGYPTSFLFGTYHRLPRIPGNILNTSAFLDAKNLLLETASDSTPGFMHALTDMDQRIELEGRLRGKKIFSLDTPEINAEVDDRMRKMPFPMNVWKYYQHTYVSYKNEDEAMAEHARSIEVYKTIEFQREGLLKYWLNHTTTMPEPYMESIFLCDTRNHKWMAQIEESLKESSFIAVGCGHLNGVDEKNGLVTLLRQKGLTVNPIQIPKPDSSQEPTVDEIFRPLCKDEFDLGLFDNNIEMALYYSCESGDKEKFKKLVKENKFDIEILIKAFAIASRNKNDEIVNVFFNVDPEFGQKALRYAALCATYRSNKPLESILKRTKIENLKLNEPASDGSTPLWLLCMACHQGNEDALRMVLDAPDLNFEVNVVGFPDFLERVSSRLSDDSRFSEKMKGANKPKM